MPAERAPLTHEEIWRRYDADEQRLSALLSERMLDLAALKPGMHVLDLASGRGEPAIRAALRVHPNGTVHGVDLSAPMLEMARERAARESVTNLTLHAIDATTLIGVPTGHFHVTLARWALQYFTAPVEALHAARRAMRPSGVLVAAVWAEPERVPYYTLPRQVLGSFAPVPAVDLAATGTFYYADEARLARDLAAAGFVVTHTEERVVDVMEAHTGAELVAWTRAFGLERLLTDLSPETQASWAAALVAEAEPLRKDGVIRLGGVSRIVVASAQR